MHRASRLSISIATLLALVLLQAASAVAAPHYINTALVKNTGTAKHIDPQMINPWGLAYGPGNPFWLSDAGSGLSPFEIQLTVFHVRFNSLFWGENQTV